MIKCLNARQAFAIGLLAGPLIPIYQASGNGSRRSVPRPRVSGLDPRRNLMLTYEMHAAAQRQGRAALFRGDGDALIAIDFKPFATQ